MLIYPSVFLSHNSADKPIVEAVARELGRRGVLPWLEDLNPGMTLTIALDNAIRGQTAVAVFLSPASIKAPWVMSELEIAFQKEEREHRNDVVIPICLGNKLELLKSHPMFQRLLHPDGQRTNRICIVPEENDIDTMARFIAGKLAESIFNTVRVKDYRDVMIYLDQRGDGQRSGEPDDIPSNLRNDLDLVGLVFRPDAGTRTHTETLHSQEWTALCEAIEEGLAKALGGPRWNNPKRIYVLGNAQSGLFYLIGRHFDRNTSARLYCSNANQPVLSNESQQPGAIQLEGGNSYCETIYPEAASLIAGTNYDTISLLLGTEKYLASVRQYLKARTDAAPLIWIKSGWFNNSTEAMAYISDVVALLTRVRRDHGVHTVRLFNTLPIHVAPLLAANLLHETDNLVFMEYRRDLQERNPPPGDTYVELQMCSN
jgi:hypothetical protein